ncbi:MAG: hypothetical protein OEZ01_11550, partial [Candidatus Heimdallarchaeota archaeon]|nr:hypothetical protein [Candidatus Heimdallarchaeota archaeon]
LLVGCVLDSSNPPRNGNSEVVEKEPLTVSPQTAHTENTRETEILSASTSGVTGTPASTSTSPSVEAGRNPFFAGTPIPAGANGFQLSFIAKVGNSFSNNWNLFIMNEVGNITRLTNGLEITDYRWSPDGKKIAYAITPYKLFVMNADGSNLRELPHTPSATENSFVWSPDNSRLLVSMDQDGEIDLFTINVNTIEVTQLTHTSKIDEQAPQWSPNGEYIVFSAHNIDNYDADIFMMDANGRNLKQLTDSPQYEDAPKWSPDGTQIAYQLYESMNHQLWVMDKDGENKRFLADTFGIGESFTNDYAWSPNSQYIAYIPAPYFDVMIVDVFQGEIIQMPGTFESVNHIRWHPGGKFIAFDAVRDWNRDIFLVNIETDDLIRITVNEENDYLPEWRP